VRNVFVPYVVKRRRVNNGGATKKMKMMSVAAVAS